jgi:hypothetical protein
MKNLIIDYICFKRDRERLITMLYRYRAIKADIICESLNKVICSYDSLIKGIEIDLGIKN